MKTPSVKPRRTTGVRKPRMFRITLVGSVSSRHAAYQRELEQLACRCEDLLPLLREGSADGIKHVAEQLETALDRVFEASQVKR